MVTKICSDKTDCSTQIKQLYDPNKDGVLNTLEIYDKNENISLDAYKRLFCFSQSFRDRNWGRDCSSIGVSKFKKSKKI